VGYLSMSDLGSLGATYSLQADGPCFQALANERGLSARRAALNSSDSGYDDANRRWIAARDSLYACRNSQAHKDWLLERAASGVEASVASSTQRAPQPSSTPVRSTTSMDCSTPQYNVRYAGGGNPYSPTTQYAQYADWQCRTLRHAAALREKAAAAQAAKAKLPASTSTGRTLSAPPSSVFNRPPASIAASQIASPRPVTETSNFDAGVQHARAAISRAGISTGSLAPLSFSPYQSPEIGGQKPLIPTAAWVVLGVSTLALFGWLSFGGRR
jgi:hypothetical protein